MIFIYLSQVGLAIGLTLIASAIFKFRFLEWAKDGGPESPVDGFFVIELKWLFSIVLLRFSDGAREAYHSHAFNALSWVLSGMMSEERIAKFRWCLGASGFGFRPSVISYEDFGPSLKPKFTPRSNIHRVHSEGNTWVLSFRGPWRNWWQEYSNGKITTLTHGRKELVGFDEPMAGPGRIG